MTIDKAEARVILLLLDAAYGEGLGFAGDDELGRKCLAAYPELAEDPAVHFIATKIESR